MSVLDDIKSLGHWHIELGPEVESSPTVLTDELLAIVRERQIRMRGWYLPHISDRVPIDQGIDWIGQESAWDYHLESWRLDTGGRFVLDRAMSEDWRGSSELHPAPAGWSPGRIIQMWAITNMTTEVLEFAARLALSPLGADVTHVSIAMIGLDERSLVVDDPNRVEFDSPPISALHETVWQRDMQRDDLAASARDIAVEAAQHLMLSFEYVVPLDTVREIQRGVFDKTGGVSS